MSKEKKKSDSLTSIEADKKDYFYLSEEVLNYDFSDFVKVRSFPRGLIFSFGKWHPEKNQYALFKEVLLPFEVAQALGKIIENQIDELVKKGLLEFREIKKDDNRGSVDDKSV